MPEALTSLLAIPAVGAALAGLVVVLSKALERRSRSWTATLNAKAALLDAEAQKLLAEARVRESQARITESDAAVIRTTVETQQQQIGALTERITTLEGTVAMKDADLREAREQRDAAHGRIDAMHADFAAIRRSGRLPKDTPPSFARFDHTQPYGVTR